MATQYWRTNDTLSAAGETDSIVVPPSTLISLSIDCSGDFSGTVKVKRKNAAGDGKDVPDGSYTASTEQTIRDIAGAEYYCEIEDGGIAAGSVTIEMRVN